MHRVLRSAVAASSDDGVKFDAQNRVDVRSDVDDPGWFVLMVRKLHPAKPGTALHALTGYAERLCQKYAAGTVKPSAFFIRNLLRSDEGWQHLECIMDGSQAPWWAALQMHKACAESYEAQRRRF